MAWCDIKDTKYGDRLTQQIGGDNAKQFAMSLKQDKFKSWFGNGKTIKLENSEVVPFVNPILQIINEKGKTFNILERYKPQSLDDVRKWFTSKYTPGITQVTPNQYKIEHDENRFINKKFMQEIQKIFPELIDEVENNEYLINTNYEFVKPEVGTVKDGTSDMNKIDTKLKTLLDKLQSRFNIKYNIVNEPNSNFRGKFDENGVTINAGKATTSTAFHEYLHPFMSILREENPRLYNDLKNELFSTEVGIKMYEATKRIYKDDYKTDEESYIEETLVQYLGYLSEEKYDKPKSAFNRFVQWIKRLFKKINIDLYDYPGFSLNITLDDIANYMVDDIYVADLSGAARNSDALMKYQRVDTNLTYENIFNRVKDKITILNATVRRRKVGEQFKDDIEALENIMQNADEITSINTFIANSLTYVDSAYARFDGLRNSVKNATTLTKDEITYNLYILGEVQQLLNVFESLNDIQLLMIKEGAKFTDEPMQKLAEAIAKHELMAADFKPFALTYLTEWLYPYIDATNKRLESTGFAKDILTKDQFREQLSTAIRDISAAGYWLGATINSQDPISGAIGLALKDIVYNSHVKDLKVKDELEAAYKKVQDTVLYKSKSDIAEFNLQFLKEVDNYEKVGEDENGDPVYGYVKRLAFHTPYNDDQFTKEKITFFQNLGPKPPRNKPKAYFAWQKAVSKWYAQNTQIVGGAEAIIDNKRATLTKRQFERWLLSNTKEMDEMFFESGTSKSDYFKARKLFYSANVKKGTFRIYSGELIRPAEKYRNTEFDKKMKDPYYSTLYKTYREANDKLDLYGLRYGIIPQISKGNPLYDKKKSVKENLKSIAKSPVTSLKADFDSSRAIQRQDDTEVKKIPIKFTNLIDNEKLDLDLLSGILKFSQMANNYYGLAEVEPNILVLKTILNGDFNLGIEGRKIAKTNSKGAQVLNTLTSRVLNKLSKDDMLNKRLNEFIDDVMYGDSEFQDVFTILGRDFSVNKMADRVGFFTALSTMALNFTGGINNVIVGNYNNMLEAAGGRFYSKRSYAWAQGEYWKNIHHSVGELIGQEKSLLGHLSEHYDVPQGEFRDQFGNIVSGGVANKLFRTSNLFFIQHGGEHNIQLTGMLALMRDTEVTLIDGTKTNLYEAWKATSKDGEFTNPSQNPNLKWTEQDDQFFRNRLHAITKSNQGIYNKFDKSVLQRRWYGKLAIMFRKYMFTSFKSRYGSKYVDYELGTVQEGYWNSFVKKLYSEAKDYKFAMITRMWTKEGYNEIEKNAMNRTLFELAIIIAAFVLAGMANDDDDKNWLQAETALQLTRLSADITQYINPSDFLRVVRNPAASVNMIEKWLSWAQQLFHPFEEYERKTGFAKKGDNKLYIKTLKVLPITRQIINIMTPEEQIKFYQLTGAQTTK